MLPLAGGIPTGCDFWFLFLRHLCVFFCAFMVLLRFLLQELTGVRCGHVSCFNGLFPKATSRHSAGPVCSSPLALSGVHLSSFSFSLIPHLIFKCPVPFSLRVSVSAVSLPVDLSLDPLIPCSLYIQSALFLVVLSHSFLYT